MFIGVSSYAEQNYASTSHLAPNNYKRPLEDNIIDKFERIKLVFNNKNNHIYERQLVQKH